MTRNIINLGVYDDKSSEFMSKLMGKTTVLSESHKFGGDTIGTKVSNVSETSRDLRTPDETRKLKKHHVYLVTAGQYPVELKTVPYTAIEPFCFKDDRKPKSVSLYDRRDLDERIANNELRKDPFSTGSIEPIIKEKEESGIEDIYSDGEKAEEKNENSSVFNFTGDVEETQNDAEDNSKSVDDNSGENLSEDLESEFEDIKTTLDTDLIDETEDTENSANKVVSDSNHSKDDEQTANGVESSEMAQNDGNSAKKGKPVRRQDARNRGRKNKHDSKLENL